MNDEVEKAKQILEQAGIAYNPWSAKVKKYGLERAREMNREARAKVKDVSGWKSGKRKTKKLGSDAEG